MDTSETYIKMMGGAWLIIKDKMPIGVAIFSRRLRMLYVLDGEVVRWQEKVNTSNCDRAYPLLEQDQLQAMVELKNYDYLKSYSDSKVGSLLRVFVDTIADYDMGFYISPSEFLFHFPSFLKAQLLGLSQLCK